MKRKLKLIKVLVATIIVMTIFLFNVFAIRIQFCTNNPPFDGICYENQGGDGFHCEDIAPGCMICNCDGDYWKDVEPEQ